MEEQCVKVHNVDITYCYRKGKYDCRHLVVIFSGFGMHSNFTYDFKGKSLDNVPSHILWIKDLFYGNSCYYLCHKMDFSVERAINDFILNFCRMNFLDLENITLVGGSKGGTAALYFGIKYEYKNIISSAPQISIGSFINKKHKDIASHMLTCDNDVCKLDFLIEKEISVAKNLDKNIYLFSSPVDQHENCIQVHGLLKKFKNFNHIVTNSLCCQQHNQITSYNLPLILSIILSHSQRIYPRFGEWFYNGDSLRTPYETEILLKRQQLELSAMAYLESCTFKDGRIFPEGVAYFCGIPSPSYGLFKKNIIFASKKHRYTYAVGSKSSELFSRKYFRDVYCDYKTIGFSSIKRRGLSLDNIPVGVYNIFMSIQGESLSAKVPLRMDPDRQYVGVGDKNIYRIVGGEDGSVLQVMPAISTYSPDICTVNYKWIKERRIHYEGYFLKYGIETRDWKDLSVWIIFNNSHFTKIFPYGRNCIPHLNASFDGFGVYEKSNFCSVKRQGVDISSLPYGIYDVFITVQCCGSILTQNIDRVVVENKIYNCV